MISTGKSDSTKIAKAVILLEKLGNMNWHQFVLHIHIENLKFFLLKTNIQISKLIGNRHPWVDLC